MWLLRQDFILLFVCICLSVIPYTSYCRLYSLLHLFCNTQPEYQCSAVLIRWRNYTRKDILNHGFSSEPCYVSSMSSSSNDFWYQRSQLQISSSTEEQQNHITWLATTSAVSVFTILKLTGIQNCCQHHPDLWTHKWINVYYEKNQFIL